MRARAAQARVAGDGVRDAPGVPRSHLRERRQRWTGGASAHVLRHAGLKRARDRARGRASAAARGGAQAGIGAPQGPQDAESLDEVASRLSKLYKDMPQDELVRQGRQHLAKDTREKVRRSVHLGWGGVLVVLILGGLILVGVFSLWLLFMAKAKNGTTFAHLREQAMSAYTSDD